jgi:mono/diheme cytochrome c family protein
MLRYFFISFTLAVIAVVTIAGFRGEKSRKAPIEIFPDMDRQPRFDPQHKSSFYADGRAARQHVEGTVPQGFVQPGHYDTTQGNNARRLDGPAGFSNFPAYIDTGIAGQVWGDGIPLAGFNKGDDKALGLAVLERGRERFNINCAVCHGAAGDGNGVVSKYGFGGIANLQEARFRTMPDGQIYQTITHGKGNMGAYGSNITVEDRWAIIAYIRALQKSQNATSKDVPAETLKDLVK